MASEWQKRRTLSDCFVFARQHLESLQEHTSLPRLLLDYFAQLLIWQAGFGAKQTKVAGLMYISHSLHRMHLQTLRISCEGAEDSCLFSCGRF